MISYQMRLVSLCMVVISVFMSVHLRAVELSEPIRYGSEINGVRVVLDIVLAKQTPELRAQTDALLLTIAIPWLPAGPSWKQRVSHHGQHG